MTSADRKVTELKVQIQQYLVESGNYEKISNSLNQRLMCDGWVDKVKKMTNDAMVNHNTTNFTQILERVEPEALKIIPIATRDAITDQIKQFLLEIVDTEQ